LLSVFRFCVTTRFKAAEGPNKKLAQKLSEILYGQKLESKFWPASPEQSVLLLNEAPHSHLRDHSPFVSYGVVRPRGPDFDGGGARHNGEGGTGAAAPRTAAAAQAQARSRRAQAAR